MGLGDMLNKAKDAVAQNRDKVEEGAGKLIDSKLDADKAGKAKDALDKGLDKWVGADQDGGAAEGAGEGAAEGAAGEAPQA